MKINQKILLATEFLLMAAVFVGNYFYLEDFSFTLKTLCSSGFALMGLLALGFALGSRSSRLPFTFAMTLGLVFACLGDIVLNSDFIIGAALFAVGHICYFIGGCLYRKPRPLDFIIGGVLCLATGSFVMFCPLLEFPEPVMRIVCLIYAFIISMMVGKAISNFIGTRTLVTGVLLVGSILFFFSDLMLVFDWFMGMGRISGILCMSTYYPAECLLGLAAFLVMLEKEKE